MTTRQLAHSDLRPRPQPKSCFVEGCEERILPSFSGRYCKAHHKAAEAWLSEERRLDNTEDGRRAWTLEWENGWDGGASDDGMVKWDDVEALIEEELVDA